VAKWFTRNAKSFFITFFNENKLLPIFVYIKYFNLFLRYTKRMGSEEPPPIKCHINIG